jgi:hypothetical protein
MRTTLDIDEDVLLAAKERARRERRSAGAVISELARRALTGAPAAGEVAETGSFYGFEPLPRRGAVVSNDLIDRLREEEPEG